MHFPHPRHCNFFSLAKRAFSLRASDCSWLVLRLLRNWISRSSAVAIFKANRTTGSGDIETLEGGCYSWLTWGLRNIILIAALNGIHIISVCVCKLIWCQKSQGQHQILECCYALTFTCKLSDCLSPLSRNCTAGGVVETQSQISMLYSFSCNGSICDTFLGTYISNYIDRRSPKHNVIHTIQHHLSTCWLQKDRFIPKAPGVPFPSSSQSWKKSDANFKQRGSPFQAPSRITICWVLGSFQHLVCWIFWVSQTLIHPLEVEKRGNVKAPSRNQIYPKSLRNHPEKMQC